ncbi:hypothetical protein X759_16010 [Mesorhizobium sp. LSHC420B00]|nr:hypothetical protein X759_16010 [Mesorhizobium sp. LSHC420B00]
MPGSIFVKMPRCMSARLRMVLGNDMHKRYLEYAAGML